MSNVKIGVGVHNKFVFEVRDAYTNELKQTAVAYNIVLNNMYTRLCSFSSFFSYIQIGTGTGTLDPARTTLFTYAIGKAAVETEKVMTYPVSSRTCKITINPEELVNYTLTEVGIGYAASGSLTTHALLKDAEGTPISITKTSLDVVIVYATIYFTFSLPTGVAFVNITPGSNDNQLFYYLFTNNGPNASGISAGNTRPMGDPKLIPYGPYSSTTGSITYSFVADAANRKIIFSTARAGVDTFNMPILALIFNRWFVYFLPCEQYTGTQYTDVAVSTGDDTTKSFLLPSNNIQDASIVVKVAGVEVTTTLSKTYLALRAAPVPLLSPSYTWSGCFKVIIGGLSYCCINGNWYYLFILDYTYSGYVYIFREYVDNGQPLLPSFAWTDYISATYFPTYPKWLSCNGLTVCDFTTSTVTAYQIGLDCKCSDAITFSYTPTSYFTTVTQVCITEDKTLLIISGTNSSGYSGFKAFINTYKLNTLTGIYEFLQTIVSKPTAAVPSFTCSCTGKYLVYTDIDTLSIVTLERIGDTYGLMTITPPAAFTFTSNTLDWTGTRTKLTFSYDETLLMVKAKYSGDSTAMCFIYKLNSTTGTWEAKAIPGVPAPLTNTSYDMNPCMFAPNSDRLVSNADVWDISTDGTLTHVSLSLLPGTNQYEGFCNVLSNGDPIYGVRNPSGNTNDYAYQVALSSWQTTVTLPAAPATGDAVTASYFVEGIHKTNQYVLDIGAEIQFGEITT